MQHDARWMFNVQFVVRGLGFPSVNLVFHCLCRFRPEQLPLIDKSKQWSRTLDGTDYMPGMVGSGWGGASLFFCCKLPDLQARNKH